ncbi:glycosyltransferase family 4 protein [Cryobacterium sp. 10I1]|uniref:glycosyltransferase family 4 protein n=1 Tax=unclassified Cryobacterium TaxID=2649013 RepID=UPI002B223CFE|nr:MULTISPECIES: glycosyltransferase family 4 protein [unclassified Cryobacterium]MEB0001334.1 glycosyltransferase family 4 protein [Cryobacterium sp. RTC2.1]MEB0303952.1 glycosyltransferase family 4 protein [Cryobacterium sp. 10I1]
MDVEDTHSEAVHIAIIVNSYPPRLGGLESHVFQLANELKDAGATVTVVSLAPEASDVTEAGVRVIRLRMHLPIASVISFPMWGTSRRLSRQLGRLGVTVVSTHTRFFPMSFVGLRAARRMGVPVIHTEHGAGFVKSPSRAIQLASRIVDLTFGRAVLRGATCVLAVSEPVIQFVDVLAGVKAEVFHNALRLEEWPVVVANRAPTGIAFLGRLVGGKGWEDFIDLAAELIDEKGFNNLSVHILGDGPDLPALKARIQSRGIDTFVSLHGHAPVETIRTVLNSSVLVNPSRLAEGFQITLLEATATAAQIVSFPVPSVQPLRADGGPIREVADSSYEALVGAVVEALKHPLPLIPRDILEARWSWHARAQEYLAVVASATSALGSPADHAGQP